MRRHLTATSRSGRPVDLRPISPADAPRVKQACRDRETIRWLGPGAISEHYSLADAHEFVARALARVDAGTHMSWAVSDPDGDVLLGHISLIGAGGALTDTAALGYWTHRAARGHGLTSAAARAVVDESFAPAAAGGGGLRRLTLVAAVGNVASQRVAEGAGFRRIGVRRQSDQVADGTWTDEVMYDLLASDTR